MRIWRRHSLGIEEARKRANRVAETVGRQYSLRSRWQGDRLIVTGKGVNGHLEVADESIEMVVQLGFALRWLEAPIRNAIENAIDDHLV